MQSAGEDAEEGEGFEKVDWKLEERTERELGGRVLSLVRQFCLNVISL